MSKEQTVKKIAFNSLGCKLSFTDNANLSREIEDYGFECVNFEEEADVYVINTCLVNGKAEKKFGKIINKLKVDHPDAKLVALGCFAEDKPEDVAQYEHVDMVLGNIQRCDIYHYLQEVDQYKNQIIIRSSEIENIMHNDYIFDGVEQKKYLNIQGNCDYYCSYCSLSVNKTPVSNFSKDMIIDNIRALASKQVKEIVINGLGNSQFQESKEFELIEMLTEAEQIEGVERIRLASLNPSLINKELVDLVASSDKLLPYFHLSVKSCSNQVLKKMGYSYKQAEVEDIINYINELIPDARIGVDIIVGYPGETIKKFEETYSFLNDINISFIHPFPYIAEPGENSTHKKEETQDEINRRIKLLVDMSKEKKLTFLRKNINTVRTVLFSNKKRDGYIMGLTDNYLKVKTKYVPELSNHVIAAKLTEFDNDGVMNCQPVVLADV